MTKGCWRVQTPAPQPCLAHHCLCELGKSPLLSRPQSPHLWSQPGKETTGTLDLCSLAVGVAGVVFDGGGLDSYCCRVLSNHAARKPPTRNRTYMTELREYKRLSAQSAGLLSLSTWGLQGQTIDLGFCCSSKPLFQLCHESVALCSQPLFFDPLSINSVKH